MQKHLRQAEHNGNLHEDLQQSFPATYFDWKITLLFYIAIHWLRALAAKEQINIGDTHFDIEANVNPERHNARMRITKGAWREYKALYHYSRSARYEGIFDPQIFEDLKKADHKMCLQHLGNFKRYLERRGLQIES